MNVNNREDSNLLKLYTVRGEEREKILAFFPNSIGNIISSFSNHSNAASLCCCFSMQVQINTIYRVTAWILLGNLGKYDNKIFILYVYITLLYPCSILGKVLCLFFYMRQSWHKPGSENALSMCSTQGFLPEFTCIIYPRASETMSHSRLCKCNRFSPICHYIISLCSYTQLRVWLEIPLPAG